ncbi:MAG: hypothetical protein R3B91_17440 [Planctomycetaceae bacterium]
MTVSRAGAAGLFWRDDETARRHRERSNDARSAGRPSLAEPEPRGARRTGPADARRAGHIYHGGMLSTSVRFFDPAGRRSGLPPDVAALVDRLTPSGVRIWLVNLHASEPRR